MDANQPISEDLIARNLQKVREEIEQAARRSGRSSSDVKLVAVSKYVDASVTRMLIRQGVRQLGENRVQAAREKIAELKEFAAEAGVTWRFIGHLQTNKIKYVLRDFGTVDAVDSIHLLQAMDEFAAKRGWGPMPCLVEVNVSGESQKDGLAADEVEAFLGSAAECSAVRIEGLMSMAPYAERPEPTSRPVFIALRGLLEKANEGNWYGSPLTELSMGMSQDFGIAIEEGSTMVRVGSALFEAW